MTSIVLKSFSGEIPNLPTYLLPDTNAQLADTCDFAQKDLRPLRGGTAVLTAPAAIKGVYTEEGSKWFTWPTETQAYKSPVIGEVYQRVYFCNNGAVQVAQYWNAISSGGIPLYSWNVGVPQPTVRPVLTLVDRLTLPDYPTYTATVDCWYESGGKQYQKQSGITLTPVQGWRNYTFTRPVRNTVTTAKTTTTTYDGDGNPITTVTEGSTSGTPADAKLVVQIIIKDASVSPPKEIFNMIVSAGATNPTRSTAFPGGVEGTLLAPEDSTTATILLNWGAVETRAYVYTVKNTFGEESAPSPAAIVSPTYIQDVRVTYQVPDFTGYRPFASVAIYRTSGTSGSYTQVIDQISDHGTYADDASHKASAFGDALKSQEWYAPPSGLQGLVALPNGAFAAFKDNVVYMSEPYRPHAWPYSQSFPHNVRGMCVGAQSLVVTTAAGVYNLLGSLPKNMQQQRIAIPQAGLSHQAMVAIEGGVAYASNDGIVFVQGSTATMNLSQQFFSREDWRSLYGSMFSDMRFSYHDGFLFGTSNTANIGFLVRLDEATGTLARIQGNYGATFYLPVDDNLYYAVGNILYKFRSGAYNTLAWWSKDYILPRPTSFSAFYIRARGTVSITIYADGAALPAYSGVLNGPTVTTGYYRLPVAKALKWSVRFQSNDVIEEFAMAESMAELRNV